VKDAKSNTELLRFPDEADVIREEAERFRRLSPTERFLAIVDLMASGQAIMRDSPHRLWAEQQRAAEKEEWRRFHRELFAGYGK
jgi:hypothetical protein